MTPTWLSPTVERLIDVAIRTVPHMEALLYLRAHDGERLDVSVVAKAIFTNVDEAEAILRELCATGLVRGDEGDHAFRYAPASAERWQAVEALANVHRTQLVALSEFIHEKASR